MISAAEQLTGEGDRDEVLRDVWLVFVTTWAAAVLFHLAGNPTLAPPWGRAVLGAAAVAVLARPRQVWLAVPLAAAVVGNVWLEAPLLGNHWLLHGFIALIVGGGVLLAHGHPATSMVRIAGPARLTLLAFYSFAAFAKLNADFFDPDVSCAVFYLRESADSWNALGLAQGIGDLGDRLVAILVAAIELSVPVMLLVRRTRNAGVMLGLAFHYVLAVDRSHQFADFSAVLVCLFLLFLDPATVSSGVDRLRAVRRQVADRWSSGPELVHLAGVLLLAGVVVYACGPRSWNAAPALLDLVVLAWLVLGVAVIFATLVAIRAEPGASRPLLAHGRSWLLVIPVIAVLNGLTPYLEVKSSAGWNMYSNLAVADGESNHFLVRRGLPLTDGHERLVRVEETTDQSLGFYRDSDWLLPERQLLDHLADRPGDVVEGSIDGEPVRYVGGETGARPTWQQKFQVFRAVDSKGAVGCQPSFGPAR